MKIAWPVFCIGCLRSPGLYFFSLFFFFPLLVWQFLPFFSFTGFLCFIIRFSFFFFRVQVKLFSSLSSLWYPLIDCSSLACLVAYLLVCCQTSHILLLLLLTTATGIATATTFVHWRYYLFPFSFFLYPFFFLASGIGVWGTITWTLRKEGGALLSFYRSSVL